MSENCFKCKKSISGKEQKLSCATEDCLKKCHRQCANIDEAIFEAISKHALIKFNCGECNDRHKVLLGKMHSMEEKMNRLCLSMSQLQARMFQQVFQQGGNLPMGHANNLEGKKSANYNNHNNNNCNNGLMIVGSNVTTDRLKVVCDFGRWVQVGKFATNTTEEDIIDYLSEELKINKNLVKCTKLVKNDANLAQLSYCKFKISIPDHRFNDLFNEAVWPSGVMVSPFTPRSQLNQNRM